MFCASFHCLHIKSSTFKCHSLTFLGLVILSSFAAGGTCFIGAACCAVVVKMVTAHICISRSRSRAHILLTASVHVHAHTHLPARGAGAVSFIFEVRHALNHPVVNLRKGQPLFRWAVYGFGDQVCVGHVPPGVSPGRAALPLPGSTQRWDPRIWRLLLGRQLWTRDLVLLLELMMMVMMMMLVGVMMHTVAVPALKNIAKRLLLWVFFKVLLHQVEVSDELGVCCWLLLHRRCRGGCVGAGRVDELRPGQRPGAGPRARERLEVRVYIARLRLLWH